MITPLMQDILFQLIHNKSNFYGGDVLRRIVRLTIETNTVTG